MDKRKSAPTRSPNDVMSRIIDALPERQAQIPPDAVVKLVDALQEFITAVQPALQKGRGVRNLPVHLSPGRSGTAAWVRQMVEMTRGT